jgi:hypothetical protein
MPRESKVNAARAAWHYAFGRQHDCRCEIAVKSEITIG